jgi:cyclopropane fatty-acyl-phospholipid synthase-like methyltransferase
MRTNFCATVLLSGALSVIAAQAPPKLIPEVPYVPTPAPIVEAMLKLAGVTSRDNVYDLGCGDGRIVITAAKEYKAHGVGIDINPQRIREARANAKTALVGPRVRFEENDLFDVDIHDATVVMLYLLPHVNMRLRPKLLKELKPGTRVVSHSFDMGDWKPEKEQEVEGGDTIYLWTVPAK